MIMEYMKSNAAIAEYRQHTFQRAYVPNILEALRPHVHQRIEESQLRKWGTHSFFIKMTDYIQVIISQNKPYEGTVSLRICSFHTIFRAIQIYSCDDRSDNRTDLCLDFLLPKP